MTLVYRTYSSLEADSIREVLENNGIMSTVKRKEEFSIISGIRRICFEIYVAENISQQALQLLTPNDKKQEGKKNRKISTLKKIYVFLALIMIVIIFTLIFLESFGLI